MVNSLATPAPKRMQSSPERLGMAAHLLRRSCIGLHSDRVSELAVMSWDDAISDVVRTAKADATEYKRAGSPPAFEGSDEAISWWLEMLLRPESGLLDRMNWFWHGVLTTSVDKADSELIGPQIHLLRSHSLGNFRDMLHGFVVDGALLQYLDGNRSQAFNPNENLARELMELFTIGRGNYSQDDVRVGARALAGWYVEDGDVHFDTASAFNAPALFRGAQDDWDTPSLVDALCDDPLTAIHISNRLWAELVGTDRTQTEIDKLGNWWHDQNLEITPLVEKILRSNEFANARYNRPKTGFEWWATMITATGSDPTQLWDLMTLGQMPYRPPNVGGWPGGDRWLSPGSMLGRASIAFNLDDLLAGTDQPWPTRDVLDRCGISDASTETAQILDAAGSGYDLAPEERRVLRWRIALCTPEFNQL